MPRIRQVLPSGYISSTSLLVIVPERSVPVTTVPKPGIVNTRSIGSLGIPPASRGTVFAASAAMTSFSCAMPCPVTEETRTSGAFSMIVPFSSSRISASAISSHSSSTRSHLVSTSMIFFTPSSSRICMCSRVCGMMPSSAATTIRTRSMPTAPAAMLLTSFSWPGTSTMPHRLPSLRSNQVKPRSVVIPLCFSSLRRSVSRPVSALISAVLP